MNQNSLYGSSNLQNRDARVGYSGEDVMDSYNELCEVLSPIHQMQSAMAIVQWDMYTMIPPRGHQQRAEQLSLMSKILHQMITDPKIENLLVEVENKLHTLDSIQQREIELIRRNWELQTVIPEQLVIAEVKQRTITTSKWGKAKNTSNWALFLPELEKLLEISSIGTELELTADTLDEVIADITA